MNDHEQRIACLACERLFRSLPEERRAQIVEQAHAELVARGTDPGHFAFTMFERRQRNAVLIREFKPEFDAALAAVAEDEARAHDRKAAIRELVGPEWRAELARWAGEFRSGAPAVPSFRRPPRASAGRDLAAGQERETA